MDRLNRSGASVKKSFAVCVCFVIGGLSPSGVGGIQISQCANARESTSETRRSVAITIDDLPVVSPGPESDAWDLTTNGILDALQRHGAPAIGFVNEFKLYEDGELQSARVDLLRRWLENGHQLGNHTFSHPKLYDTPIHQYTKNILDGEEVTREIVRSSGGVLEYFRHPFLNTGRSLEQRDELDKFLSDHGYRVAPVTIDNYDFEFARAYQRALVQGR